MKIICPICSYHINDDSIRKKCGGCGNGDRTRSLFLFYRHLARFTKTSNALVFTAENWLSADSFASCYKSIYLGENHLDIQKIGQASAKYSWIACNHVLEHVKDYSSALKELFRVTSDDGVIQLTIPTPSRTYTTYDWNFPDSAKMGHYRNFGADFSITLRAILPSSRVLVVFLHDDISPYRDITYLILKDEGKRKEIADALFKSHYVSVPL